MFLVLISALYSSVLTFAQQADDIPAGIKVKRASASENALAKHMLEGALSGDGAGISQLFGDAANCGPTLWAGLRPSADTTTLQSKIVSVVLPNPIGLTVPARALITEDQKRAFWKLLLLKYPALQNAKVRSPKADELRYYWAIIPFESIDEPFFAIDAGSQVFIANLRIVENKPVLFWIDLVGDLNELSSEDLTGDEVREFEKGAEAGLPLPMYTVGLAYLLGKGVPKDLEKGKKWTDSAARQGSLDAQMLLWSSYASGTILPKDPQLSAKYLLMAVGQEHVTTKQIGLVALAQFMAATMYEQGIGVEKSHDKAIRYLQLSATNGNYNAQFALGNFYNQGLGGFALDKVRACELFEKAADQGHRQAIHNVAYCYQTGSGGKKDFEKARIYYTKTAELGDLRSQRNLGLLYGQLEQAEKSYFWLRVAEVSGDTQGKSAMDAVKAHLTESQVTAVENQVTEWLGSHQKKPD